MNKKKNSVGRPKGMNSTMTVSLADLASLGITEIPVNTRIVLALSLKGKTFKSTAENAEAFVAKYSTPVVPVLPATPVDTGVVVSEPEALAV